MESSVSSSNLLRNYKSGKSSSYSSGMTSFFDGNCVFNCSMILFAVVSFYLVDPCSLFSLILGSSLQSSYFLSEISALILFLAER